MKIENRLVEYNRYHRNICACIATICKHSRSEDIQYLDKIVLLDSHDSINYKHVGGMYFLKRNSNPAYIEVYVKQLVHGMPKFVPKFWIFMQYSFARLILHEIGHHVNKKFAYERNREEWERTASEYEFSQLWKIYGLWMYIFLTMGSFDKRINKHEYGVVRG